MQRALGLMLVAIAALVGCNKGEAGKDGGAKVADSTAIQGKWNIVEVQDSGRKPEPEQIKDSSIEFSADKMTLIQNKERPPVVSAYKLDEAKKHIDLKDDTKPTWSPGIYELKGDELRLCLNEGKDSSDRPTEFKSEQTGPNDVLLTLRRAK